MHAGISNVIVLWSDVPDDYGNAHVTKGDDVKLPCHVTPTSATNVTWLQKEEDTIVQDSYYKIYINGQIHRNLRRRFSIYNAADGDYSLIILKIHPKADAGNYRCFDQQQLIENYVIYVRG